MTPAIAVVGAVLARRVAGRTLPNAWGNAMVLATVAIPAVLVLKLMQTPASLASPWAYVLIAIGAGMAYGGSIIAMQPRTSPGT